MPLNRYELRLDVDHARRTEPKRPYIGWADVDLVARRAADGHRGRRAVAPAATGRSRRWSRSASSMIGAGGAGVDDHPLVWGISACQDERGLLLGRTRQLHPARIGDGQAEGVVDVDAV